MFRWVGYFLKKTTADYYDIYRFISEFLFQVRGSKKKSYIGFGCLRRYKGIIISNPLFYLKAGIFEKGHNISP